MKIESTILPVASMNVIVLLVMAWFESNTQSLMIKGFVEEVLNVEMEESFYA